MDEIEVLEELRFCTSHKRGSHTKRGDRLRLWEQQQGKCWWCKRECRLDGAPDDNYFNVDHIIPLSRFGTNHWRNLVGSCYSCNEERDLRWRRIRVRWIRTPEPTPEVSTFTLAEKMSILLGLEFLSATESS